VPRRRRDAPLVANAIVRREPTDEWKRSCGPRGRTLDVGRAQSPRIRHAGVSVRGSARAWMGMRVDRWTAPPPGAGACKPAASQLATAGCRPASALSPAADRKQVRQTARGTCLSHQLASSGGVVEERRQHRVTLPTATPGSVKSDEPVKTTISQTRQAAGLPFWRGLHPNQQPLPRGCLGDRGEAADGRRRVPVVSLRGHGRELCQRRE
jgi:hypothetical protein